MGLFPTVLFLGSLAGLIVEYRSRGEDDFNIFYMAFIGAWLISLLAPLLIDKGVFALVAGQVLNATFIGAGFVFFRSRAARKRIIEDAGLPAYKILQYLIALFVFVFGFAALGALEENCIGRCRGIVYLFGGDFVRTGWLLIVLLGGFCLFFAAILSAALIRRALSMW